MPTITKSYKAKNAWCKNELKMRKTLSRLGFLSWNVKEGNTAERIGKNREMLLKRHKVQWCKMSQCWRYSKLTTISHSVSCEMHTKSWSFIYTIKEQTETMWKVSVSIRLVSWWLSHNTYLDQTITAHTQVYAIFICQISNKTGKK